MLLLLADFIDSKGQAADTVRVMTENGWIDKMSNQLAVDVSLNNLYQHFEVKTPIKQNTSIS